MTPHQIPELNQQPTSRPIDPAQPAGFRFPSRALGPTGPTGTQPTDPYTPLLRAYANDHVQVRAIVGANHHPHFFDIEGVKWLFEPADPNSGYRNSQQLTTSEHFEFVFTVPGATTSAAQPFADYLYRASAGAGGLASGAWGLLRAFDGRGGNLLPDLKPLPNNPTGSTAWTWSPALIPADAAIRRFNIVATTAAQALPGGRLTYNGRGQVIGSGPTRVDPNLSISSPDALIFVRAEDLDASGHVKAGIAIEPLILRVAAGDWIQVTLRNDIDPAAPAFGAAAFLPFAGTAPGTPYSTPATQINYTSSTTVGLQPQLLAYDITANGANVGMNPVSTVVPARVDAAKSVVTYTWYAGNLEWDAAAGRVKATPIEFGVVNLAPPDPVLQHRKGLYGALVVEPRGATWAEDPGSHASATVTAPGTKPYREFAVLMTDDSTMFSSAPIFSIAPALEADLASGFVSVALYDAFHARGFNLPPGSDVSVEDPGRLWLVTNQNAVYGVVKQNGALNVFTTHQQSINYRSEPFSYRYPLQTSGFDTDRTGLGSAFANEQVGGTDPETPVFVAEAGMPIRFRLAHPDGVRPVRPNGIVFIVNGHQWQEEPYVDGSTRLGVNPTSNWLAFHERYGPLDHFDVLIERAGGTAGATGDFFYGAFPSDEVLGGTWGILRIVPARGGKLPDKK